MAALNCHIHLLLNVPLSPENYKKEINIIKQIAINNVYDHTLIDKKIKEIKWKQIQKLAYTYTINEENLHFHSFHKQQDLYENSKGIHKAITSI
ncbi:hypothetical protein JTB14_024574 [Gonioctena quinquepunctata]|nr:hypothetical protein JTB14_024574 [Gonioctena quinquepunctata]